VAEHHPDAILLGLHMPVIDGIQAILLAAARVGSTLYADQTRDLPDGLTAREAEILALIARGMTNPRSRRPGPEQSHGQEHINRIRHDQIPGQSRSHPVRPGPQPVLGLASGWPAP
jgi:CheY-like chemotaxis protein